MYGVCVVMGPRGGPAQAPASQWEEGRGKGVKGGGRNRGCSSGPTKGRTNPLMSSEILMSTRW